MLSGIYNTRSYKKGWIFFHFSSLIFDKIKFYYSRKLFDLVLRWVNDCTG